MIGLPPLESATHAAVHAVKILVIDQLEKAKTCGQHSSCPQYDST
jgi:hypothetical protein